MDVRVTIISFIISIISHVSILAIPGLFPGLAKEDTKTIQIQIEIPYLLPAVEKISEKKILSPLEYKPVEETEKRIIDEEKRDKKEKNIEKSIKQQPLETKLQGTINKSTKEETDMLRYQDMVKQKIQEERKYPVWAIKHNIQGSIKMKFTVLPNGKVTNINLLNTSGHKILDTEAIETIKRASPFPKFPHTIDLSSLHIEVTIIFSL